MLREGDLTWRAWDDHRRKMRAGIAEAIKDGPLCQPMQPNQDPEVQRRLAQVCTLEAELEFESNQETFV